MNEREQRWTGQRLRHYRRSRGLTQKGLARQVELIAADGETTVHQSSISNWERGVVEVSLRYRHPLAEALGVPVHILFEAPPDGWQPITRERAA